MRWLLVAFGFLLVAAMRPVSAQEPTGFDVVEADVVELQRAMQAGRVTSVELVDAYLARIAAYDGPPPSLGAILRVAPDARREAERLDRERAAGRVRGPLHGIPVVVKDNFDVRGLPTSGATLALAGLLPPDDAFQVRRLREAGTVIIAKTNLHELASGITTVSAYGGRTRNPYAPSRNPGGSSGGTAAAVAASFAALGWGSDTCGSIRIPAAQNHLVGLRPTKGLSSIDGVLPLSRTQDTAGPLARTVTDLAIGLDATVGFDPADPATRVLEGTDPPSFRDALDPDALRGARIGILEPWMEGGEPARVVREALAAMEAAGAEVVDVPWPEMASLLSGTSVIRDEFKHHFEDYLAETPGAPIASLGEILERGLHHEELDGVLRFWNGTGERDSEEHRGRLEAQEALRDSVVSLLQAHDVDALAYPSIREVAAPLGEPGEGSSCQLSAHTGLPAISIPAGFSERAIPVGLELLGRPFDDARLVALAYAFEGASPPRRPPLRTPALEGGAVPPPVTFQVRRTGAGDAPGAEATFRLSLPEGTLEYRIEVTGLTSDAVHAVVLERRDGERPHAVVERLAGPGATSAEGTLSLRAHLLRDLVDGRLALGLHTEADPLGPLRLRLDPSRDP